jgi:hypothetical protein
MLMGTVNVRIGLPLMLSFAAATLMLVVAPGIAQESSATPIPEDLKAPANEKLLLQVHATGDQIYTCQVNAAENPATWVLKAPDAKLFSADGKVFGKHFAGPSWEAADGSRIVGKAAANAASPNVDAVPWLLVKVVSHAGSKGVLTPVTSIQRINTKGGKAPADGCNAAGLETRSPYSADYLFYVPK